jgi:hypothetical protein
VLLTGAFDRREAVTAHEGLMLWFFLLLPYALETDWLARREDSNLCISESDPLLSIMA